MRTEYVINADYISALPNPESTRQAFKAKINDRKPVTDLLHSVVNLRKLNRKQIHSKFAKNLNRLFRSFGLASLIKNFQKVVNLKNLVSHIQDQESFVMLSKFIDHFHQLLEQRPSGDDLLRIGMELKTALVQILNKNNDRKILELSNSIVSSLQAS